MPRTVNFDRLARPYRWLETLVFGHALQRARIAHLGSIPEPHRALIIGEGDGRFLRELLCRFPKVEVDCVDGSARMIALAQARVRRTDPTAAERVRFSQCDLADWEPSGTAAYDLVITHFVLDCFDAEGLAKLVQKLSRAAAPESTWLLADFYYPAAGWSLLRAKFCIAAMYRFFRLTTGIKADRLIDPSAFLEAHGFRCIATKTTRAMIESRWWRRRLAR